MKLLLDMNLTAKLVPLLKAAGHDCVYWQEIGSPAADDEEILLWAKRENRVVVTLDLDFGTILAIGGLDGPSVIQVRRIDPVPKTLAPVLVELLDEYKEQLECGAMIVVDERRPRIRLLPFD